MTTCMRPLHVTVVDDWVAGVIDRPHAEADLQAGGHWAPLPQTSTSIPTYTSPTPSFCQQQDYNYTIVIMKLRKAYGTGCHSRCKVTALSLLSFLALSTPSHAYFQAPAIEPVTPLPLRPAASSHTFTLRNVFHRGLYQDPDLHRRFDVKPDTPIYISSDDDPPQLASHPQFSASSHSMSIERLVDRHPDAIEKHLSYARLSGQPAVLDASQWTVDWVPGPNISDKDTVINIAYMAANAYAPEIGQGDWTNVSQGYNHSASFGWEGDGLRGHVFADESNTTIIVGLKGTSPAVFDGDGTTTSDKLNDNLFFSCCCGQGGQYFWRQVCDCQTSTYTCNSTCVTKALKQKSRYYQAAIDLYTNITELYPDSNVWLTGHSLGGAVSSLLGQTFGLPVVTYEAPGDDLAAKRLGLPYPPGNDPHQQYRREHTAVFQIGHTADPVYMGTCNGATSTCTLGGYAMESQCHSGKQCVYDTVGDSGWRVGIGYHKIHNVIDSVLKKYPTVPKCERDTECVDCFNWKYFDSNGSESTTSMTTSTVPTITRTRTSTCKTPGWWGCLDEPTTTSSSSTPVVTTTFTTTSCATPGWFGCKEETTVTVTTTTASKPASKPAIVTTTTTTVMASPTSDCDQLGWFGCDDPSPSSTASISSRSTATPHTCETPGLFFGCHDRHTRSSTIPSSPITPSMSITSAPAPTSTKSPKRKRKCKHRAFFGLICLDDTEGVDEDAMATGTNGWNSEL